MVRGPEVAAEWSPSVLLWLLQEFSGSLPPGATLTSRGFEVVSALQVVRGGKSGREEARLGMTEPDTDRESPEIINSSAVVLATSVPGVLLELLAAEGFKGIWVWGNL